MKQFEWIDNTKCPDCGYTLIDVSYQKTDDLYGNTHGIIDTVMCSLCGYPYKVVEIKNIYARVRKYK